MCRSTVTTRSAPAAVSRSARRRAVIDSRGFRLPVLARVAVERRHRGDAPSRRALRGVDHDQLFDDAVVDRLAVRLQHEHVGAADAVVVAAVHLAVGEARERDRRERHVQVLGDLLGERRVAAAGEEQQALLRDELHGATPLPGFPRCRLRHCRASSTQSSSIRAGMPLASAPGGTSRFTTAPARGVRAVADLDRERRTPCSTRSARPCRSWCGACAGRRNWR